MSTDVFLTGGKLSIGNFVKYRANMSDADLCQTVAKERQKERERGKKEEKTGRFLPGLLRINVKRVAPADAAAMPNRIDSLLQPVRPFDKAVKRVVQELDVFAAEGDIPFPYLSFLNQLCAPVTCLAFPRC